MYRETNRDLFAFLRSSPTSYHAAETISVRLQQAGFLRLSECHLWDLTPGGKYFVTRNNSSVIAFSIGREIADYSFNITASHSDSPSFKLKEQPLLEDGKLYTRLNTEKYGGAIDASWLDRPLSLAGRVILRDGDRLETRLVDLDRDVLLIPNVAIHMNREINNGFAFNEQVDTLPLFAQGAQPQALARMVADAAGVSPEEVAASELFLCCRTAPVQWGPEEEFISAPRLDDLQCAYATLQGFLTGECDRSINVYCCFDNEEVGSLTKQGAASSFFSDTLWRVSNALGRTREEHLCALASSFMLSADNAHAIHPNHPELSDAVNRPVLNGGPVIKVNAAQSYATDGPASALFRLLCQRAEVPVQRFANRSDKRGGGTLGNIAAGSVSIRMADIGLPQLAMHSCYETAGARDTWYLIQAAARLYSSYIRETAPGVLSVEED